MSEAEALNAPEPVNNAAEVATAEAQKGKPTGTVDANLQVSNLKQLKEQAPEVYDMTNKSLAQQMIRDSERRNERVREEWRKMRRENG